MRQNLPLGITRSLKLVVAILGIFAMSTFNSFSRTKPVEPSMTLTELEDSGDYYLYNVGANLWVHYNPSASINYIYKRSLDYDNYFDYSQLKLIVSNNIADRYQFKLQNGRFLYSYTTQVQASNLGNNNDLFTIQETEGGFFIRKSPESSYYKSSETLYLGFSDNSDYLVSDLKEGNIIWKILPASYVSRQQLFDLLEKAESSGFPVSKYDAIYDNAGSTIEELNQAYMELRRSMAFTQSAGISSGDYGILLQDDPHYSWQNYNKQYLYRNYNMNSGEQQVLTATIEVDSLSTLFYNVFNANTANGTNASWNHAYHNSTNSWSSHYYSYNSGGSYYQVYVNVYIDGLLVRTIDNYSAGRENNVYFEDLLPGNHTIQWVATCPEGVNNQYVRIKSIRVEKTPEIAVTLVEPGSLGTEVLYQLNRVQDVRRIKISGEMNSEDWKQIDNMTRLYSLDLSDADITSIPAHQLHRGYTGKNLTYLYKLRLPKQLQVLGESALCNLNIDEIELPSTLTTIGATALQGTYIKEITIPESVTTIGNGAFASCFSLTKANIPSSMTSIPSRLFYLCYQLKDMVIPENITSIASGAFARCMNYKANFPSSLQSIGEYAFFDNYSLDTLTINEGMSIQAAAFSYTGIRNLHIPRNVNFGCSVFQGCQLQTVSIDENSVLNIDLFKECRSLTDITLPSTYFYISQITPALRNCSSLKNVRFKSPTMLTGSYKERFFTGCSKPTLYVPDFLVTTYKQDAFWKEYTITGFPSDEVDEWHIKLNLTLTYRDRLEGNPDVFIDNSGRLTVKGDAPMNIHNLTTFMDTRWPNTGWSSEIISDCENVVITGDVRHQRYIQDNTWYMLTMPFDFRVSDIETTAGDYYTHEEQAKDYAKFAIRYYDGAHRAAYGNSGNWVDFPTDSIVTAGTGFIIRTSKSCYITFVAVNNASKQIIMSNNIFAKALEKNPSENEAHRGWNLVGNPYPCYYNIHKLGTQAPITVYEYEWKNILYGNSWSDRHTSPKYKAYSLIDDDYALLPNAAFFIQCPQESSNITFPTAGRQLTSVITDQTGVKAKNAPINSRRLIDLQLSNGEDSDQTRVVFNPLASLQYETVCDASKFMSEQNSTQIYTVGNDDIHYAINERPENDGIVPIGMMIPASGTYTLSVSRTRGVSEVILHDKLLDTYTDINTYAYDFDADAGLLDNRFELVGTDVTAIADISQSFVPAVSVSNGCLTVGGAAVIYSVDGRRVTSIPAAGSVNLQTGVYVIAFKNGKSQKIIVK